ncbi:unnamed protein product [Camellia sinensis]
MEKTNSIFLSCLCFIFFFMNSPELITTAKGNPSLVLTNETDHQALLAIKDLIQGDPLGALSAWNHSIHFCNWQGVSCGRQHQRVTLINLSSLALVGSVSPQIGNLTFLRRIDLGNNSFHGKIPQEIGKLFRLQYLQLVNNSFQGEFPINLIHCSNLRVIHMGGNNLGGKIPTDLGSLSNLSYLILAANHLTGAIPHSIGNLSNLHTLSLPYNNLDGSIPTQLGQLSKLEYPQLSANNLSGMVPTSLYNISSIYFFSINKNQLHGILPLDLGLTLPNLPGFYVSSNQFYGQIPSSIANATRLVQIGFTNNSFTGPMPMNLGTLYALESFVASDNSLGTNQRNELMSFLTSLFNCSSLTQLDLATNHFKGLLPHSIANLSTKITWLTLQDNYIFGSIPLGIGNLVNLQYLVLDDNMLTSSIPNSIGKLSTLEILMLYKNNIPGEIPSSIRNLSIGTLDLSTNTIEGSIPISLGNCTNLQQICLHYNHLTGAIPSQIFGLSSLVYLSLSQNYLTGLLPQEVEISATLSNCEVLEFLYIDGNLFEGTISMAFRQLKGIQELDVSRNNLSGQIPRFLREFRFFQYLNLSYNMFDGYVPNGGVFTNSSAFSVVGNSKLCGGIKLLQLPACPIEVLHERKRPSNHRVIVLVVTLTIVVLSLCILAILYRNRRSRQQVNLASPLENQYPQLYYGELFQATNGFSAANLIGEGGHGYVYKGILNSDEQIVAVKVLNLHEHGANKIFVTECQALKNIHHRNLVKIITACSSIDFKGHDFKALVFEFMENGSLENWLHPSLLEQHEPKNSNFVQRLNIAIDVACALDYLHHHCEMTFIHCDLNPSNILLDGDLCAHVGDFGLAKIFFATNGISIRQQSSSIGIRETIGYVAPEYGIGEEVSTQGPTSNMFTGNVNLHSYVKMCLPEQVMQIVDPQIILEMEVEPSRSMQSSTTNISKLEACLVPVFQIGVSCSVEMPSERMSVKDVLKELPKIRNVFLRVRGQRRVTFTPTVEHCNTATVIGLCLRVKLMCSLPIRYKVDIGMAPELMQLKLYGFDNELRSPGDAPQGDRGRRQEEIDQLFKSGKKMKESEKSAAEIALLVENVMAELKVVAEVDAELNRQSKPTINKLKKLPLLMEVLSKQLHHRVLTPLKTGLEPVLAGSLPNINIRGFPIDLEHYDRREQLKKSGLGKVIMFLLKSDEETPANRRMAKDLVDKWEESKSGQSSSMCLTIRPEAMPMDFLVRLQSKIDPDDVRPCAKQVVQDQHSLKVCCRLVVFGSLVLLPRFLDLSSSEEFVARASVELCLVGRARVASLERAMASGSGPESCVSWLERAFLGSSGLV